MAADGCCLVVPLLAAARCCLAAVRCSVAVASPLRSQQLSTDSHHPRFEPAGDVNGDGKGDLLLNPIGGTSRLAFSLGGGEYRVITHDLPQWKCEGDQKPVVGDVSRLSLKRGVSRGAARQIVRSSRVLSVQWRWLR